MKARFFALAALVLGLASCQQEFNGAAPVGGEVDFQLSVDAVELATRAGENGAADAQNAWDSAFGAIDYLQALKADQADAFRVDWTEVDLRYSLEVYDAVDSYVDAAPVKDRQVVIVDSYEKATFDLRLVPNRNYRFVVFADFVPQGASNNPAIDVQDDLGLSHVIGNDLRDIKIKNDAINAECTDAYFASEVITISNSAAKDIVLTRPYGKVRVIATDLAELNLNVDPAYVVVNYTAKHPQTFNAVTGTIGSYEENVSYEFLSKYAEKVGKVSLDDHYYTVGCDAITTKNNNDVERHTHMTLFTDYILATKDQQTIQFTMAVYDKKNGLIKETNFNTEIPVQRNNLTTVIGNVLTTATEINVTINDNFANEIEKPVVFVNTAKELQEALDAYKNGQTILFDANIEGNVTVDQVAGKDYVIDGNGYEYTGTITIDGNARMDEAETVLIKNVNFVHAGDAEISFIEMNSTDGAVRYAHNVTIEKCTFNGGNNTTAVKFRQCKNITIKNCNVLAGHSLAQLYGCSNVTIEGTTVKALRGVSFGTSTNCEVKNSAFEVEKYGLRVDADGARTLVVKNSSVKAFLPVVARKASAKYTFKFEGDNVLEAPGYDVVFTKGDDEATFVAPAEYAVEGADNFKVFPRDNYNFVYTADDLKAAVAAGGDYLLMPTTIEGTFAVNTPVILKGLDGATIKGRVNVSSNGSDSQFKNIKFAINDASKHKNTFSGANYKYPGIVVIYGAATSFDGCEFETSLGASVCGINYGAHAAGKMLKVNNCEFTGDFYAIRTRTLAEITNNKFNVYTNAGILCAVWTWGNGTAGTDGDAGANSVVFENNTNVNEHGIYGVQATSTTFNYANIAFSIENNNGFITDLDTNTACNYTNSTLNGAAIVASADEIAAALTADKANVSVVLAKDIDLPISKLGQQTGGSGEYKLGGEQTENITIDLNGYKLNITTTYWSAIGAKNDNALFTIKNGTMTSSQPTGTWNSYDLTFSNCNYVIEDVVFEKAIAFTATGKSASLKNVTINETHDYYAMWICAEGLNVTADNLTIESAGRGIKIDEQYVDAPAKVTLTVENSEFTTANKAAILVKSAAGAEINVKNLDITGVAADKVNAVWVDADSAAYFDLVTVNGASKKQE